MKRFISLVLTLTLLACLCPALADNSGGTSEVKKQETALVIGGSLITNGKGFLNNVIYQTQDDIELIYSKNSGEATYRLGLGDCFTDSAVRYSTYENHGAPEWIYRTVIGLDIQTMAQALGIDTDANLSVAAISDDGSSKVLSDAFGSGVTRYSYDTDGTVMGEVKPVLALYETSFATRDVPGKDSTAKYPTAPEMGKDSPNRVSAVFGYGQTAIDEINSCFWIKSVNKLRIGPEDVALTVNTTDGKVRTSSLSGIILGGIYRTKFIYDTGSYDVEGSPLKEILDSMGAGLTDSSVIKAQSGDSSIIISASELDKWFAAWEASVNGSGVVNSTALMLFGPSGQFENLESISILENTVIFDDMDGYSWALGAVQKLCAQGIVKGTGQGRFSPQNNIKRGDFVLMLCRAFGFEKSSDTSFTDVAPGSYWYDAISAAQELGIAKGADGKFRPAESITRQDAMVLMYRAMIAAGKNVEGGNLNEFSDAADVSGYAREAVAALVKAGIINGSGGRILPAKNMTRAEMAVALNRALENL